MKNILVLCTGNSCRSQIAHGYLRKILAKEAYIYSAGIEKHGLNPYAVSVMKMDGIDISSHSSNLIEEYMSIEFDFIITVCDHANETCPYIPSKKSVRIHKNFLDPSAVEIENESEKIMNYVNCREEIKDFCIDFKKKYNFLT
jgi:arsenate reductase